MGLDDVRAHVPELSLEVPVTLRQCLRHTGGLPEWYTLQALTGVPLAEMTEQRLLEVLAGIRHTTFAPGTDFSYSDTGYVLAAVVVGRVAGSSLAEFARERLFEPLGMTDSVFRDDASVPLERLAYGYATGRGEPRRADTQESAVGDGGLVTSVAELAPWLGCPPQEYGEAIRANLAAQRALIAELAQSVSAVRADLTVRSPFRRALQDFLDSHDDFISEWDSFPGADRPATVAEVVGNRQLAHSLRLRYGGTCLRMLDAELGAGNQTPAIRAERARLGARFDDWFAEAEADSTATPIPIRTLVAVQLGAALLAAESAKQKP